MKTIAAALGLLALVCAVPSSAQAEPVTFEFAGTLSVSSIPGSEWDWEFYPISGYYTFDSDAVGTAGLIGYSFEILDFFYTVGSSAIGVEVSVTGQQGVISQHSFSDPSPFSDNDYSASMLTPDWSLAFDFYAQDTLIVPDSSRVTTTPPPLNAAGISFLRHSPSGAEFFVLLTQFEARTTPPIQTPEPTFLSGLGFATVLLARRLSRGRCV